MKTLSKMTFLLLAMLVLGTGCAEEKKGKEAIKTDRRGRNVGGTQFANGIAKQTVQIDRQNGTYAAEEFLNQRLEGGLTQMELIFDRNYLHIVIFDQIPNMPFIASLERNFNGGMNSNEFYFYDEYGDVRLRGQIVNQNLTNVVIEFANDNGAQGFLGQVNSIQICRITGQCL